MKGLFQSLSVVLISVLVGVAQGGLALLMAATPDFRIYLVALVVLMTMGAGLTVMIFHFSSESKRWGREYVKAMIPHFELIQSDIQNKGMMLRLVHERNYRRRILRGRRMRLERRS